MINPTLSEAAKFRLLGGSSVGFTGSSVRYTGSSVGFIVSGAHQSIKGSIFCAEDLLNHGLTALDGVDDDPCMDLLFVKSVP